MQVNNAGVGGWKVDADVLLSPSNADVEIVSVWYMSDLQCKPVLVLLFCFAKDLIEGQNKMIPWNLWDVILGDNYNIEICLCVCVCVCVSL